MALKEGRFLKSHQYPDVNFIADEYLHSFAKYIKNKLGSKRKRKKPVVFVHIKKEHFLFLKKLMKK